MNMNPGKYPGKLASPFVFVHGVRPDPRTWLPLFFVCYFHHEKDSDASRSKSQAHTMDGIVLGQSPTSNAIYIYNPHNQRCYNPDSYRIDPYHLPLSVYPTIKSMTVASLSHSTTTTTLQSVNCTLLAHKYWTFTLTFTQPQDAPVPVPLWIFPLIQLHHYNTSSCGMMAPHALFWPPTCHPLSQNQRSHHQTLRTSMPFLQPGSKITYERDGQ
jgi:hypothetical protein